MERHSVQIIFAIVQRLYANPPATAARAVFPWTVIRLQYLVQKEVPGHSSRVSDLSEVEVERVVQPIETPLHLRNTYLRLVLTAY